LKRYLTALNYITPFLAIAILALGCGKAPEAVYPSEDTLTPGIFLDAEAERAVLPEGVEVRKVYDKGIELTKESEGFRGRLYNDAAGYCTIGYGHLIKLAGCDGSESSEFRAGIGVPRGTEILRVDMEKAETGVMILVDVNLTDGQYAALCDFVFNVGAGNFKNSTLRRRINARDFDRVPFEFRRWVYAGGRKLSGLAKRRENEIKLFFEEKGVPRAIAPPDVDLSPIDIRTGETGS
jgi:GH24 family phage-related lysozyme (muramidase)